MAHGAAAASVHSADLQPVSNQRGAESLPRVRPVTVEHAADVGADRMTALRSAWPIAVAARVRSLISSREELAVLALDCPSAQRTG
jgi:hypothetical protein